VLAPQYVAVFVVAVAIVGELARRRTLGTSDQASATADGSAEASAQAAGLPAATPANAEG
jgi:hypothetical protein